MNTLSTLQRVVGDKWDISAFPTAITLHHRDNRFVHLRIDTRDRNGDPCFHVCPATTALMSGDSAFADYNIALARLGRDASVKRMRETYSIIPKRLR